MYCLSACLLLRNNLARAILFDRNMYAEQSRCSFNFVCIEIAGDSELIGRHIHTHTRTQVMGKGEKKKILTYPTVRTVLVLRITANSIIIKPGQHQDHLHRVVCAVFSR